MANASSILLIDDHALFRSGVALVLASGLPGIQTCQAGSLDEALRLDIEPALVLLDVQLQGISGLEGMAPIHRKWPLARVVMVSAHDAPDVVDEAMRRGAASFISKTERPEVMVRKIQLLLSATVGTAWPSGTPAGDGRARLTTRQCEVLDLLCQGLSNKVIGRRLNISEHTVRGHVQAMLATLHVASRSEAIFAARRLGLVR